MVNGQVSNIFSCLNSIPTGTFTQLDSSVFTFCPEGQTPYLLSATVLTDSSLSSIQNFDQSFDLERAAGFISFGFGCVLFFFMLGLKGSVLIKLIWPRHY